jgi:hypothetical protein
MTSAKASGLFLDFVGDIHIATKTFVKRDSVVVVDVDVRSALIRRTMGLHGAAMVRVIMTKM